jgi:hypothetical protein
VKYSSSTPVGQHAPVTVVGVPARYGSNFNARGSAIQ